MSTRLDVLAAFLMLLAPAAYAITTRLVIDNGGRHEVVVASMTYSPGQILIVPDVITANGFEPQQRAPPAALRDPPATAVPGAATSGTEARGKGLVSTDR